MITRDEAIERAAAILEGVIEKSSLEVKNCFATISIAYSSLAAVLPVETEFEFTPKEEVSIPVRTREEPRDYVRELKDFIVHNPNSRLDYEGISSTQTRFYLKKIPSPTVFWEENNEFAQCLAREWLEILKALEGVK